MKNKSLKVSQKVVETLQKLLQSTSIYVILFRVSNNLFNYFPCSFEVKRSHKDQKEVQYDDSKI